jgi:ABC-2 type transport system ATP-binding protein
MTGNAAIEATGLAKSYGTTRVLDGIDVHVRAGSVFALLGPNGAGKTTTVRILATLTRPDAGSARVAGYDVLSHRHEVRRRISLTGQSAALDELQTGAENLRMIGRLRRLPARAARVRASELLAQFDLAEAADRRVGTYSGGMRRRLDLAAGLIIRPAVLFLDEPTTGLDPRSRQAMWRVVNELTGSGVTVLLTTQYLDEADHLAARIAVMDGGRIVADGTPDELKRQVAARRLEMSLADLAGFEKVAGVLGRRVLHEDRPKLTLEVAIGEDAAELRALLDEIDPQRRRIARFAIRAASLDDVFMSLTGHDATAPESEIADV